MADLALETQDLWFEYPEGSRMPALRGVDFRVRRGESVALVGANGSGKTTLAKQFNGLLRPRLGVVRVGGQATSGRPIGELAREVGYLFQHPEQQIFATSVWEEVAFGPRNLGLSPGGVEALVGAALERFGLTLVADEPPAVLSYGQRRRITLASLAAMDTPVVILDEPTVGLDAGGQQITAAWLAELRSQGRTVVLVTHDMSLVAEMAERVVVLGEGQVQAEGTPTELFGQPDLLARAALVPPPVAQLAEQLTAHGLSGDGPALHKSPLGQTAVTGPGEHRNGREASAPRGFHLTVDGFVQDYVQLVESRARLKAADRRASPHPPGGPGADPGRGADAPGEAGQQAAPISRGGQRPKGHKWEGSIEGAGGGLGGYRPGESWLHRLDPRTKMWAVLLMGVAALTFRHPVVLAGILVASHAILLSARTGWGPLRWLWMRLWPLLVMILILQPLFAPGGGPDLWRLGPVRITAAGLLDGVSFALRAAALAFAAAILFLSTDPTDLVQGLVKLGLPYPWGLTVGLAVRYLPTTYGLFTTIREAQQARGWIVDRGGFVRRARAYLPILVATLIAALRLSDNLELALAARGLGYPAQRTTLHEIRLGATDVGLLVLTTVAFAGAMYARFGLGLGAGPGAVP